MDEKTINVINEQFSREEAQIVINELNSIGLHHVMANSETNLTNTHLSILKLAKGDVDEVVALTKHAKIDFRDVIMWATQER